jgi:hypothetical protein
MIHSPGASSAPQPVTVGLPFPQGALTEPDGLALCLDAGKPLPLQSEPLARWADGSVKWLLVDSLLGAAQQGCTRGTLAAAESLPSGCEAPGFEVTDTPAALRVSTTGASFSLEKGQAFLCRAFLGEALQESAAARIVFTDARGRKHSPRVEQVAVETRGPVRTTIRCEGVLGPRNCLRFVARLCFFAGTGLLRLRLTVHNPRRARHAGGLWDLGDANSVLFRDLSVEVSLEAARGDMHWMAEPGQPWQTEQTGKVEIYQNSSGGENWCSRNHVNCHGQVPCSFRGYRIQAGNREHSGLRASPVLLLEAPPVSVAAAIPEFWQQFPKAIEAEGTSLRLRLFPGQLDLFELQGGEQKTHTIWLHIADAGSLGRHALDWVHHPAVIHASPEWYGGSGLFPAVAPAAEGLGDRLEPFLREALEGEKNFFAKREVIDEYGWRHYGEVYGDHEAAFAQGPQPLVSHYNNQYDVVYGTLLQFYRTGDRRWLELCEPLARHVIDIDIYHTNEDKAAYNGGLFWFTDHYKDAATCTHRTFSRANAPPGSRSYGGGPGSSHNFTTGLLDYFYRTGDPLAREAVLSLADWVVNMEDGRKNILGLVDDGPTGMATFTAQGSYHGPGRGCGLSVNALLDAWLLTDQRSYLETAEVFLRRCVHPADNVAERELLDVERRWSYTVFLSVLARYLQLKADAGELDFMYAYVRASLLLYAGWMLEHEVPYFNQAEKLEYPTETWAAQEFRKANVLRLAAMHAQEPLRQRLLDRGGELADRAWSDLLRFESRTTARAFAILLTEGPRDSFFRTAPLLPDAPPSAAYDFGSPQTFIHQKYRVLAQLKSVRGLGRALLRLASPRTWLKRLVRA